MGHERALEVVVLASGKRLHGLCSVTDWADDVRLVGLWSPEPEERDSASARYRVPSLSTPTALVAHGRGALSLVGGLRGADVCREVLEAGEKVLAWPPFLAADDPRAVGRLIVAARQAAGRWRVARPSGRVVDSDGLFGEHVPMPREALGPVARRGSVTPQDRLLGRAAVALACLDRRDGGDSVSSLRVDGATLDARLEYRIRAIVGSKPVDLSMSLGEGLARALALPSTREGAGDREAFVAPAWTADDPGAMVAALRASGSDDDVTYSINVLKWAQALFSEAR